MQVNSWEVGWSEMGEMVDIGASVTRRIVVGIYTRRPALKA